MYSLIFHRARTDRTERVVVRFGSRGVSGAASVGIGVGGEAEYASTSKLLRSLANEDAVGITDTEVPNAHCVQCTHYCYCMFVSHTPSLK